MTLGLSDHHELESLDHKDRSKGKEESLKEDIIPVWKKRLMKGTK